MCSAVLLPIVLTVYIMWWFLEFFDGFFSPLYDFLFGFHVFGLGFLTTMFFVFGVGGEQGERVVVWWSLGGARAWVGGGRVKRDRRAGMSHGDVRDRVGR